MPTFRSACAWRRNILNAAGFNVYKDLALCAPFASPATLPWTSPVLAFPAVHRFAVRRFSGVHEGPDTREITLELDASGARIVRPASPTGVQGTALASATARVTAVYQGIGNEDPATSARLYYDNGTGIVDYVTPLAEQGLDYEGSGRAEIGFDVAGLVDGTTYLFVVRARTAEGAEDENTDAASVTAVSTPPAAVGGQGSVSAI